MSTFFEEIIAMRGIKKIGFIKRDKKTKIGLENNHYQTVVANQTQNTLGSF
jgi:hypothetical protein